MCVSCFAVRTRYVANVTVRWPWSWARCNVTSVAGDARSSRGGDAERAVVVVVVVNPAAVGACLRDDIGFALWVRAASDVVANFGNGDFHGQNAR